MNMFIIYIARLPLPWYTVEFLNYCRFNDGRGVSGYINFYAFAYTSVWCHEILVTAPEI